MKLLSKRSGEWKCMKRCVSRQLLLLSSRRFFYECQHAFTYAQYTFIAVFSTHINWVDIGSCVVGHECVFFSRVCSHYAYGLSCICVVAGVLGGALSIYCPMICKNNLYLFVCFLFCYRNCCLCWTNADTHAPTTDAHYILARVAA